MHALTCRFIFITKGRVMLILLTNKYRKTIFNLLLSHSVSLLYLLCVDYKRNRRLLHDRGM